MAERVIRGYWDCPQCGVKGIDGLKDTCPGCGAGKDKNVRYYMKEAEEVSEAELSQAGIAADENDGKHREWVCAYCGNLNNFRDKFCVHCGASREEKAQDYGGDTDKARYTRDAQGRLTGTDQPEPALKETYEAKPVIPVAPSRRSSPLRWLLLAVIALGALFLLWPHTAADAISGFRWERAVTVEELQTFSESGWSLPSQARQTDVRMEFYGYQQVLDHYETVYETRTRQVVDHYETSYTYTDNGNGTFTEHPVREPVYRIETYQEAVREPVYRNEPVYQRKYYYDIDRWVSLETYETAGEDHEPYWSSEYTLTGNQRDTSRSERYYTLYTDGAAKQTPYEKWAAQSIGDGVYVTTNRLGMEYARKEQE